MDRKPDKQTMMLLNKHLAFLKKKFKPLHVYLFGSRAGGDHLESTDIALLVVYDRFKNLDLREGLICAYGMWDKQQDLEQICYTPDELEKKAKEIGIVQQALKEGVRLI